MGTSTSKPRSKFLVGRRKNHVSITPNIKTGQNNCATIQTPMVCPVCGGEYVHVVSMSRIDTPDAYVAHGLRGVVDMVFFNCENDDQFVVCYGFHEGVTYTWTEVMPEPTPEPAWYAAHLENSEEGEEA
jgi:hypothetical protein